MKTTNGKHHPTTIAIIDDDQDILDLLSSFFTSKGFTVLKSVDGISGLALVREAKPDLVLLDIMLPDMSGFEICRRIKEDPFLWYIPVIYLTAKGETQEKVDGFHSGTDDYITKPFEFDELLARIQTILLRSAKELDANPLTKLPGNCFIQRKISEIVGKQKPFAICYLDINQFKSYNDRYGFIRGDKVILTTAETLISSIREFGLKDHFIGHIGGDDFIIVSTPDRVERVCEKIIQKFDELVPILYDDSDRKNGFVLIAERSGGEKKYPFISLSIAVVTNEKRKITHLGEISAIAADLKRYIKTLQGSHFIKDRRISQTKVSIPL